MKGYEKLEQHLIHQGKVVGFYEDIVKLPSGKVVTWDLVKHKGAAAVVPVTDKGTILLVRRNRFYCWKNDPPNDRDHSHRFL